MNAQEFNALLPKTARGWQLFAGMPGVNAVVGKLNRKLAALIAAHEVATVSPDYAVRMQAAREVFAAMYLSEFSPMCEFSNFGAHDTDPRTVLVSILMGAFEVKMDHFGRALDEQGNPPPVDRETALADLRAALAGTEFMSMADFMAKGAQ